METVPGFYRMVRPSVDVRLDKREGLSWVGVGFSEVS